MNEVYTVARRYSHCCDRDHIVCTSTWRPDMEPVTEGFHEEWPNKISEDDEAENQHLYNKQIKSKGTYTPMHSEHSRNSPRVLLSFHHFRTPKDMGGLRSWHIGRRLVHDGYIVEAIIPAVDTLSGTRRWKKGFRLRKQETIDGVNINWISSLANNRKSKLSRIAYFITFSINQAFYLFLVRRPHIVISTSLPLSSLIINFLYSRILRIPFLVDVRDTHIDSALATGIIRKNWFVKILLKIETAIFKRAEMNIPVTKGMDQILSQKGVPEEKRRVIQLGYDGKEAYEDSVDWSRDIRKELGLEDKFIALYSGTLGFVFDLDTILNAAWHLKDYDDIVFLFAGGGQRLDHFKAYAQSQCLNTRFLGLRPKHDVPLLCRQADVALYAVRDRPALKAILGNKIFDYLGNGTPIVNASKGGDVEDLLYISQSGISVQCGDSKSMADAIFNLYSDTNLKNQLGENAENFIRDNMTASQQMEYFSQEVKSLLQRSTQ